MTFTFTMDAFPDYLKFDKSHKVLAAMQIVDEEATASDEKRTCGETGPEISTQAVMSMAVKSEPTKATTGTSTTTTTTPTTKTLM